MKKIFLVFLILALGIGSYAYFRRSETIQTAKPSAVVSSFFPTVGQKQDVTDVGTSRISLTGTPGNTTNTSVSVGNTSGGSYGNTPHAISIGPVAGFTVLQDVPNKGSDTIRYVDRASGFVYEQAPNASPLQISNIRLPNIYEAVFAEGGKSVLLRFLGDDSKTIGTYYVPIPEPDTTGVRVQAKGIFLPNNIGSLVVFSHGKKIAFTTVEKGSSIVRIANPNGSQPQMFFSYPFTDWLLLASDADLYLQTKAYSSFPGTLFSLTKNDYKKIISHVSGLTALVSPSGHYVLSATTGGATPIVSVLQPKTGLQKPVSLSFFPEECTWNELENAVCAVPQSFPTGNYPENWYQGLVHFADDVAVINSAQGTVDKKPIVGNFDMTNLSYSPATKTLYFIEKGSGMLYALSM